LGFSIVLECLVITKKEGFVPLLSEEMVRIGEKQTVETKNRVTVQLNYSLIPPVDLLEEKYDNTGSN